MSPYTIEGLYRRLQKIMQEEKCDIHGAFPILHAQIREDPDELARWWEGLGLFWLKEAERYYWRRMGVALSPAGDTGAIELVATPEVRRRSAPLLQPARPKNWRQREGVNPMDVVIPVGSTGERKRVGHFTRTDCEALHAFYEKQGRTMLEESRQWKRIADRMGESDTLETTLGRLTERQLAFLSTKLRFPVVVPAAETQEAA